VVPTECLAAIHLYSMGLEIVLDTCIELDQSFEADFRLLSPS
jgi:hypothetical protein